MLFYFLARDAGVGRDEERGIQGFLSPRPLLQPMEGRECFRLLLCRAMFIRG